MVALETISDLLPQVLSADHCSQPSTWMSPPSPPLDRCVHAMIEDRCHSQPKAAAVRSWDGDLTYQELEMFSTRWANVLLSKGIKPGRFVPVLTEKSRWTAVAIQGIMKAGGAFLLLESGYPVQRMSELCDEIDATVILASSSCASLAARLADQVLVLGGEMPPASNHSEHTNRPIATSDGACHIIFTSGSTGTPKGIVISHSAYVTMATNLIPLLNIGPSSRVLQFSSYAFDVGIMEQMLTLIAGSCVCIPSETERASDLSGAINRLQVNWVSLTPSVARVLKPEKVPGLQTLCLVGEAVSRTEISIWAKHVQLMGLYGPAETTLAICIQTDLTRANSPTNLGRPFASRCWVVDPDDHDSLVQPGAAGELIVESHYLSRGYLGNPMQTAKAFINAPSWYSGHTVQMPAKFYKTGDLVRNVEDGSLVYLGRKDTQVKLRGQRLELGEIEHNVRSFFAAAKDVIAEMINFGGNLGLCAFIQVEELEYSALDSYLLRPSRDCQDQIQRLRSSLAERLPQYMVPETYFLLSSIPKTATEKADRRALKNHVEKLSKEKYRFFSVSGRSHVSSGYKERPRTKDEETLQALWGHVLNVDSSQIGRDDGWFEHGGDSLLAMQLVAKASEKGLRLTVKAVFEHPTLCQLAGSLTPIEEARIATTPFQMLGSKSEIFDKVMQALDGETKVQRSDIEDIYPCTMLQKALILGSMQQTSTFSIRVECKLPLAVDEERLSQAWHQVQTANPLLHSRAVQTGEGEFWQVVLKDTIPLEYIPSSDRTFEENPNLWAFKGPLVKAMKQDDSLAIIIHHVLFDHYSIPLMFQHLERAYCNDDLPCRPYTPFLKWLSSKRPETDEFWRRTFDGYTGSPYPGLPLNANKECPPPAIIKLPPRTVPLQNKTLGISADSKMRLALALVAFCDTGHADIVFGATVNRRGAQVYSITELVGPTTSIIPIRIQLDRSSTLSQTLKSIQDQALGTAPFEEADLFRIGSLSPEAALASQIQAILIVQPDPLRMVPPMFSEWRMLYDRGNLSRIPLCVECELHGDWMDIFVRHNSRMDRDRGIRILDRLVRCFELIDSEPHRLIGELHLA